MLTSNVKVRLDVPDQVGQWVEIRKLGWRKLRDASDAQSREAYANVRALGKDGIEAVRSVTAEQIAEFKRGAAAPYDTGTILRSGIVAWSFSEKPTTDEIDDLDEDVAEWLKDQIVLLAKPPRDEDAAKNV